MFEWIIKFIDEVSSVDFYYCGEYSDFVLCDLMWNRKGSVFGLVELICLLCLMDYY